MERIDRILTQEEYSEIRAEITRLEMEEAVLGKDNSQKIKELEAKIS